MKKSALFMIFITILSLKLSASLLDIYKSGKLKLVPDPNFGKGTAWDIYFPQGILDIAFTKDGSFFATGLGNKACHCVYKFDKNGKFIKKIGRKGRGPGDLYAPGDLSILDNKYLLVGEYASSRRISVFDLKGNFIKIIRTRESVFDVVGLKNNIIAIYTLNNKSLKSCNIESYSVYLLNMNTNKKNKIKEFENKTKKINGIVISIPETKNHLYIIRTFRDNLLCGFSGINKFYIYSKEGKLLNLINTEYKREKMSEREKETIYRSLKKTFKDRHMFPIYLKTLKKLYKNGTLFPDYKPCYRKIKIDSEGNILIFGELIYGYDNVKENHYIKNKVSFDIWNKEFKYVRRISVDPKSFEGKVLSSNEFWFYRRYIYYFDDKYNDQGVLKRVIIR